MRRQTGATAVEFALVLMLFLVFFLGIVDFARMLWTWSAANEATRMGARLATVCNNTNAMKTLVVTRMQNYLPQLTANNVNVDWYNQAGAISTTCNNNPGTALTNNCIGVSVSIVTSGQNALRFQWISPLYFATVGTIPMPSFITYLPVEIMGQDPNSSSVCT